MPRPRRRRLRASNRLYHLSWTYPPGERRGARLTSPHATARSALNAFLTELVHGGRIHGFIMHDQHPTASYTLEEDGPCGNVACSTLTD